ncbi:MAG TPA: FAD-binding protein, partial [Thermodesulfobacteriota bacterium]|nr:FAD-binding protein [Thermodesulfobacteriota bacterium]
MASEKAKKQDKASTQYSLFFIQRFKGKVLFNVPMSEYTSWRIGGPADVMAFPQDEGDLKDILSFAEAKDFPVYILGAGTNVLVRDGGIRGIVINVSEGFRDIAWQEDTRAVVGAGVKLTELLGVCKEKGLSGLEFSAGIPGTVGGAVMMNAGAFGGEMK